MSKIIKQFKIGNVEYVLDDMNRVRFYNLYKLSGKYENITTITIITLENNSNVNDLNNNLNGVEYSCDQITINSDNIKSLNKISIPKRLGILKILGGDFDFSGIENIQFPTTMVSSKVCIAYSEEKNFKKITGLDNVLLPSLQLENCYCENLIGLENVTIERDFEICQCAYIRSLLGFPKQVGKNFFMNNIPKTFDIGKWKIWLEMHTDAELKFNKYY